jgi:5-methyltetrahydropteroyltriglutamate--homocysteine methyltransferase
VLRSTDRILTTHVGSLPRSQAVTDVLFAREGNGTMPANPDQVIRDAVIDVVTKQVKAGIDIVSDGEMGKISYATYIKDRLSGFDGDTPREPGQDLVEHPRLLQKLAKLGSTASYRRPKCVSEIKVKDLGPMNEDIANFNAAISSGSSPGSAR